MDAAGPVQEDNAAVGDDTESSLMHELAALNAKLQRQSARFKELSQQTVPEAAPPAPVQEEASPVIVEAREEIRPGVVLQDAFFSPAKHRPQSDTDSSSAGEADGWNRSLWARRKSR